MSRFRLGKIRKKILLKLFGKNLYADAGRVSLLEDRLDDRNSRLDALDGFIVGQRDRIDHLYWLSWYRTQKYAPESKYPEILADWYREITGRKLDLKNPRTFNEKIQWLKLYDATPLKTRLADKYLVRGWIAEKIGDEYLIPLLGVWDNFDDIDFDSLPGRFVLKANHGSAWNITVKDKSQFDRAAAKRDFDNWMRMNFAYCAGLELHYRDIEPKIIAEQYMEDRDGCFNDYKITCFNGVPHYISVVSGRSSDDFRASSFYTDWTAAPFTSRTHGRDYADCPKPEKLSRMLEIAKKLSGGFVLVRVDLYCINDEKIYFGEMTFTPLSGITPFVPEEYNIIIGNLVSLPERSLL
jgi:hypothetical protein